MLHCEETTNPKSSQKFKGANVLTTIGAIASGISHSVSTKKGFQWLKEKQKQYHEKVKKNRTLGGYRKGGFETMHL